MGCQWGKTNQNKFSLRLLCSHKRKRQHSKFEPSPIGARPGVEKHALLFRGPARGRAVGSINIRIMRKAKCRAFHPELLAQYICNPSAQSNAVESPGIRAFCELAQASFGIKKVLQVLNQVEFARSVSKISCKVSRAPPRSNERVRIGHLATERRHFRRNRRIMLTDKFGQ